MYCTKLLAISFVFHPIKTILALFWRFYHLTCAVCVPWTLIVSATKSWGYSLVVGPLHLLHGENEILSESVFRIFTKINANVYPSVCYCWACILLLEVDRSTGPDHPFLQMRRRYVMINSNSNDKSWIFTHICHDFICFVFSLFMCKPSLLVISYFLDMGESSAIRTMSSACICIESIASYSYQSLSRIYSFSYYYNQL